MTYRTLPAAIRIDVRVGDINYGGHMGNEGAARIP
jgi:hypothetical protein